MLIRELIESNKPGMYVYHASYLPDQTTGLKSILTKGLQPSAEGYAGPGVYFAYDPEGGYYHVSKEDATLFRVKWADLVNKFGTYPDNQTGIERDDDEIVVPGIVPASMLEVEYFPGEWWDLKSALAASRGPVEEAVEPTRIKLGAANEAAKAWIAKVYAKYPLTMQNNHVMVWGSGDEQQFAMFELVPSFSKRGAVEVKWFQAYPLRQGVGSKAMQELQSMARADGIALTLFPWDKGQVSQAKLTKFYRGQGFKPTVKGSKSMAWETAEEVTELFAPGKDWKWSFTGKEEAVAVFHVGSVPYVFTAYTRADTPDVWEAEFKNAERGGTKTSKFGLTGTGNSAEVMSTIADIMRAFLEKYKDTIRILVFNAKETSRQALYARMAKRLLPDWRLTQVGGDFILTAPK